MSAALPLLFSGVFSHLMTNLDNAVALIALVPGLGARRAIAGWIVAQSVAIIAAVLLAEGAEHAIGNNVGLLGVVPLVIGLRLVWQRHRHPDLAEVSEHASVGFIGAVLMFLSMSGDTVAVFVPLLADTAEGLEPWIIAGAVMSVVALAVPSMVARRPGPGLVRVTERAERLLPYLMIAIGIYVLANTGTD